MNANVRIIEEVQIIDAVGHIDFGTSPAFRKAMLDCLKTGDRLAANLAEVAHIDSSGIATLLEVLKESKNKSKTFMLFALTSGCGVWRRAQ